MRNLTLLTDLYELTMMQGYFKTENNRTVIFDAFHRKNPCDGAYAISCGLEQVIDYIKNLHFTEDDIAYLRSLSIFDEDFLEYLSNFHFTGDIYAIPEGTVIFPREPIVKVIAPIMEAQLVETAILNIINHQSLIATKAPVSATPQRVTVLWNSVYAAHRTGRRYLRCKSRCYCRLCRYEQRPDRSDVWCAGKGNTRPQLDYELSG